MNSKTLFISAGHSNTDPGAVANGWREADIAVEFRNIVAFYLDRLGVTYDTDGKGTENLPLATAAAKAKKCDVAVEFHCNAAENKKATGVEALAGPKDMRVAASISAAIAKGLNLNDRGAKPEDAGQHSRLAFVRAGGIIVELFFLTNAADLNQYQQRKWLAAKAVAETLSEVTR